MKPQVNSGNTIGLIGVFLGVVSLGMALFHFWYGALDRQPSLEDAVAKKALSIKEIVVSKIKGDKEVQYIPAKRTYDKDKIFDFVTVGVAFTAIVLSVVSFVKREDSRASIIAALLGVGAITFNFLTVALGAIVFVILIASVLGALGLG